MYLSLSIYVYIFMYTRTAKQKGAIQRETGKQEQNSQSCVYVCIYTVMGVHGCIICIYTYIHYDIIYIQYMCVYMTRGSHHPSNIRALALYVARRGEEIFCGKMEHTIRKHLKKALSMCKTYAKNACLVGSICWGFYVWALLCSFPNIFSSS